MKLGLERGSGPIITGFSRGSGAEGFKVEAGEFRGVFTALTISPLGVDAWAPPPLDMVTPDALAALVALDPPPEFLLLGTGSTMQRPPAAFVRALEAQGIGVEAMDSRAASRAWAVLRGEGRWVAAALYPL